MNKILFTFLASLVFYCGYAQDSANIKFRYSQNRINDKQVELIITAIPAKPAVKLFPLKKSDADPIYTTITFDSSVSKKLADSIKQIGTTLQENDPTIGAPVDVVKDSVQWHQLVNIAANDSAVVKGEVTYLYKLGEEYPSGDEAFRFVILPDSKDETAVATSVSGDSGSSGKQTSLWLIFLGAFGGGLLALLTPCVYSMIPVTVSFFTKRSTSKQQGIKNAISYALSIVIIFTLLGFLITVIFGPAALNNLSTNWIANLIFFALFVIFGISFLGAFEIQLPSSWTNKTDSKASTGNFLGIFFMALTLVLVSFSCTGPIIGNLLVLASKGSRLGPLIGMFGFSLALSLPFALFAFFPSKLNVLGKAGGWLNAIKVTLGFLELALALKFLSNADLAKNWRILDREIFIALWIVIFILLGVYLLGKLKFKHDDELPKNDFGLPYLSVTRLVFAIASFFVVVYLTPGLFGAPLKGLGAFLPPMGTQDFNADDLPKGFNLSSLNGTKNAATDSLTSDDNVLPEPVKYAAVMKKNEPDVVVNNGMITYFDYNEALQIARKVKKPLMLDFTGINCVNCRLMESQVWSDPEIMDMLKNDFVIASLFVDVHGTDVALPISEQFYSKDLGKQVEDLGDYNTNIQVTRYESNSQPNYFFLDGNEKRLLEEGYGYNPSKGVKGFKDWLQKALDEYKKRRD